MYHHEEKLVLQMCIRDSLGDEQYKRLMAYMKALQKLEQMESIVED